MKKVIVNTLNFSLDKALSNNGNESDDKLFEQLLEHIRMTLISEDIQDDNRVMVAQTIEMLVDKIHQYDKVNTSVISIIKYLFYLRTVSFFSYLQVLPIVV